LDEVIHLAEEVGDAEPRLLMEEILHDEDAHVDWLAAQLDQISQMSVGIYLSTQTRC
jgi:bacterioferritin